MSKKFEHKPPKQAKQPHPSRPFQVREGVPAREVRLAAKNLALLGLEVRVESSAISVLRDGQYCDWFPCPPCTKRQMAIIRHIAVNHESMQPTQFEFTSQSGKTKMTSSIANWFMKYMAGQVGIPPGLLAK